MRMPRVSRALVGLLLVLFLTGPVYAGKIAEREVLDNGLVLLHAEKGTLPIVQVVVVINAGSIMDPPGKAGLSNLTADLLNEGTEKRSAKDISDAIEFVGGSLSVSGGDDFITLKLSVLKKDVDLGLDLLSDIILHPAFRDEEIQRRKAIILSAILQEKEDPGAVASKAFSKAVFDDHPYGWPAEGTEESIQGITRGDIVDFHKSHYFPNNAIMAVVGDLSGDEVHALIDRYFKGWKKGEAARGRPAGYRQEHGALVIKVDKDITQANIILGHRGVARDNPDYYALSVMNYILGGGGFASRLMDNIRDNKGLSYDVHSSLSAHRYAGSFEVVLQTKNRSANTAIAEILREMERMRKDPVGDKELADAKAYMTGSFPLRLDSNSKLAAFLAAVEYYGLGQDYVEKYGRLITAVTKEDILKVARKYLDTKDFVLVVVGNIKETALEY